MEKDIDLISFEEVFILMEKIMDLVYDFNQDIDYSSKDKEYFIKLKNIKIDKKPNKLLEKIYSILYNILHYIIASFFDKLFMGNATTDRIIVRFLAACNAVNNNRDKIMIEDVIIAYKTFYKLFEVDILPLLK
jgi:hypothetical protein